MASQSQSRTTTMATREAGEAKQLETIVEMNQTISNLINNTNQLDLQSKEFNQSASKPADLDVNKEVLKKLQAILRGHNAEHGTNLEQVKKELLEEFRKQYEGRIKDRIRQEVRDSLIAQVKVQVDQQIAEHIPVALKNQLEDAKAQLRDVKIALKNSEARTRNGLLNATDLNSPLSVVLTPGPEPKKSELYPLDMCSLLAYRLETTKSLLRDYGLVDSDDFEENVKTFLTHIGVHTDCIPTVSSVEIPAKPSS